MPDLNTEGTQESTSMISNILDASLAAEAPTELAPELKPEPTPLEAAPEKPEKPAEVPAKPDESELEPEPQLAEGEFDPEIGAPQVTVKDGKETWHYTKQRGQALHAGFVEAKKYKEVAPTLEDAQKHADAYVDQVQMIESLQSGDPNGAANFMDYWARVAPEGVARAALKYIESAPYHNPQAYSAVEQVVIGRARDFFYGEWAKHPDKTSLPAEQLRFAYQAFNTYLTGETGDADPSKVPSATDERLREIERREQALIKQDRTRSEQARSELDQGIRTELRQAVTEEIEKSLESAKELKKERPLIWKAMLNELQDAVRKSIVADKRWSALFQMAYERTLRERNNQTRTDLVTDYRNRARRVIAAAATGIIDSATAGIVEKSAATHEQLAASEAAGKKAPGGAATAKSPSIKNEAYEKAKLAGGGSTDMVKALMGV